MKKILIIVILLLLVGGGGGGAYWWFVLKDAGGEEVVEEEEEIDLGPPPIFVELPALTVPVIRNGNVARYIILKMSIEVPDSTSEQMVIARTPGLRNAYLRDLHGYFSTIPVTQRLNITPIKKRLAKISQGVLGKGIVKDILITNAFTKDD